MWNDENPLFKQLLNAYFLERTHGDNLTARIQTLEGEASRQRNEIWELKQKLEAAQPKKQTRRVGKE